MSTHRIVTAVGLGAVAAAWASAAPTLVQARAWPKGEAWSVDLALAGPVTVEARDVGDAPMTFELVFDEPLIAYRSLEVVGGEIVSVAFAEGDAAIRVEVADVRDASHVIVRVVDAVSASGVRPLTRAQTTILGGDLRPDGRINVYDAAVLMDLFGDRDLSVDMDLDGAVTVFDAAYLFDRLTAASYTLENLPPTITPVGPQHAEPGAWSGGAAFVVRDDRLREDELAVWATSGDPSVVADGDIEIVGSGGERTVRFLGAPGADGSTTLTVHVGDGEAVTTTTFPALVGPDTAPTALIDASGFLGVAPLEVRFDAGRSVDEQRNIASWAWDFGGAGTASGPVAAFTFAEAGTHEVVCTVSDASGLSDEARLTVTVADEAWDASAPATEAEARRFLWQAGFGPSDEDVAFIVANGFGAWIDAEIAEPASYITDELLDQVDALPERWRDPSNVWEAHCVQGPDQLRQRMAWALIQVIPVRSGGGDGADYYNLYVRHALGEPASGASGTYDELLTDVTYHAVMGDWLTYDGNRKANPDLGTKPDENYAREIKQLFTIGLWELARDGTRLRDVFGDPIPTYDPEADVAQFARIFTGLGRDWPSRQMEARPWHHEFGPKRLLDYPGAVPPGGYVPASEESEANLHLDVQDAIANLFHHPTGPPFLARLLIKRLVTSNPSAGYVERVAEAYEGGGPFGSGVRGDLRATVRAILLDDEARNPAYWSNPHAGKPKEPVVSLLGGARAMGLTDHPELPYPLNFSFDTGGSWIGDQMGQGFLRTPSVFNFYQPTWSPPNTSLPAVGHAAPEFQILDDQTAVSFANLLTGRIAGEPDEWDPSLRAALVSLAGDPVALVDAVDMRLTHGTLGPATRQIIERAVMASGDAERRVRIAVALTLVSPEYRVVR